MEFWGVEVKCGEPLKVSPGDGMVLHLSQASLGELKKEKGNESICLFVNVDGKKLVLGTLFSEKLPQQQFDLVFDRDFEISHNWKSGSVYFYGYKASNPYEEDFAATELPGGESDDSESDEEVPLNLANNGKPELKPKQEKPVEAGKANAASKKESDGGKPKPKTSEPKKAVNAEEDVDSTDDDMTTDDDDDDEDDTGDSDDSDESDDSDDDSDESDEETPKKVGESSKKRPASVLKTPVPDKKAKAAQQKTDGKKGEPHVATPHPAKQAGKTPASKPNQQTPKSGGISCKSCNRTFGSEQALDSHTKAKHGK